MIPLVPCWRALARGIRGMLRSASLGHAVYESAHALSPVRDLPSSLIPPSSELCFRCGARNGSSYTWVVLDLDQAFEACGTDAVCPACARLARRIEEARRAKIINVRRGKRNTVQCPPKYHARGCWCLDDHHLHRALQAKCSATCATLGGVVYQLKGLDSGGVTSSAAVSVHMCDAEVSALEDVSMHSREGQVFLGFRPRPSIGWCRYVDEICACSSTFWSTCVVAFLSHHFPCVCFCGVLIY